MSMPTPLVRTTITLKFHQTSVEVNGVEKMEPIVS